MWFIGVEVEQETSAPLPRKNPGSAHVLSLLSRVSLLCSRERKRGPGNEEEEPPDLLNDVLNIF